MLRRRERLLLLLAAFLLAASVEGQVRYNLTLVNDHSSRFEGRVDATPSTGGTTIGICSDGFDDRDALVICRQLGLPTARASAVYQAWQQYRIASWTDIASSLTNAQLLAALVSEPPVFLTKLACKGTEASINDCDRVILNSGSALAAGCNNALSVGVKCFEKDNTLRLMTSSAALNSTSGTLSAGRLEIWLNSGWGLVGAAGFDALDARLACRDMELPFAGAVIVPNAQAVFGAAPASTPLLVDNVECTAEYEYMGTCPRNGAPKPGPFVGLRCQPEAYAVRLVDGPHPSEGRLEAFVGGRWGTVCNVDFDISVVYAVCTQIGFSTQEQWGPSFRTYTGSSPRPPSSPVLFRVRRCSDKAYHLLDCSEKNTTFNGACSASTDVYVKCYASPPVTTTTEPPQSLCVDLWSSNARITPKPGSTTMLVGEIDDPSVGERAQDVLLLSYEADGTLLGHAAFGRPWTSVFAAEMDYAWGPIPKPGALLLADMTGDGRDDLVVVTELGVRVSVASGARSFADMTMWLDLSETPLRIDTTNTTTRAYLFMDTTGDQSADMVFFDRQTMRLAYYPSDRKGALVDGEGCNGITWFELTKISARCASLGEDCFFIATDANGDGLADPVLVYLDRLTAEHEVYLTFVATSPPSPLSWYLAAPAVFPRGSCTSPWAVVMGDFVGPTGSVDDSTAGSVGPQVACLSSYDARVYVAGLGAWGHVPGQPTRVHVADVNLDGRADLIVFTELGSYYMLSTGSNFEAPVSTAQYAATASVSMPVQAISALGETDQTAATVIASAEAVIAAPVELRCSSPRRVVAYFANRRPDRSGVCDGVTEPFSTDPLSRAADVTHVIFASMVPNADTVSLDYANARDEAVVANLVGKLASLNPAGVRALVSVGGEGGDFEFPRLVLNDQSVSQFANASLTFLRANGLQGLELSWPSVTADQVPSFLDLVSTLSTTLRGAGMDLALAVPPYELYLGLPWEALSRQVDMINFKTFDLDGEEVLGAAPYIETPLFSCLEMTGFSVNTMIDRILAAGASPQRMNLITSAQGRSFVLDGDGWVGGPGSPGPCMGVDGLLDQSELRLLVPPGGARLDTEAFANYAHFGANSFVHYDDPFTVCFARAHCLGGVGVWDVDSDSYGELIRAVTEAVYGDPATCIAYEPPQCTNTISYAGTEDLGTPELVATLGDAEFMLFQVRKTWEDAREHCKALRGDLAAITTRAEASTVYSLLTGWAISGQLGESDIYSGRDVFVWLGGNDAEQEGRFVWANSSAELTYTAWAGGQPDGRFGGEDCLAASIRLAGSSGAGLRQVQGSESQWFDMGCTLALPFVCQRSAAQALSVEFSGAKQLPFIMGSLLVLPPAKDSEEPGLMRTMAEGQKICRTLGGELPSLTDIWSRDTLLSDYKRDLPPYMWIGLRSYGEGEMFWSDGSYSTDGLLNAWEPGEFGNAACAIIVGPAGADVTLRADALYSSWNGSAVLGATLVSPPPPPPPRPPSPGPSPPLAPRNDSGEGIPPSPPDSGAAPASSDTVTLRLRQGVYSLSCQERAPVVCQRNTPVVSLAPTYHCLSRPDGLAWMVAGEQTSALPLAVAEEADCAVQCMLSPRCAYYIFLPNWRPANFPEADLMAPETVPHSCYRMGRPWPPSGGFAPKVLIEVTPGDRVCFRTDAMFVGDTVEASPSAIDSLGAYSPLFGSLTPLGTPNTAVQPFSVLCAKESDAPVLGSLRVAASNAYNIMDLEVTCLGPKGPGVPISVLASGRTPAASGLLNRGNCDRSGIQGIRGASDQLGICWLYVFCGSGAAQVLIGASINRKCPVGSTFEYSCPRGMIARGVQGATLPPPPNTLSPDLSRNYLSALRLVCVERPAFLSKTIAPPPALPPPAPKQQRRRNLLQESSEGAASIRGSLEAAQPRTSPPGALQHPTAAPEAQTSPASRAQAPGAAPAQPSSSQPCAAAKASKPAPSQPPTPTAQSTASPAFAPPQAPHPSYPAAHPAFTAHAAIAATAPSQEPRPSGAPTGEASIAAAPDPAGAYRQQ
ncbi:hypothetical protein HYH03_013524 [Edaphochlamys debaryana]|uniref:Chitinase n=1 Tax=Edaphochlamys debaryana TaxID=47281 RepID=A0A836BT47_9CHLO|nr:hypothetical protein HYH03_013524 [Edaphochlamys debaryana]|eukprot:KAG2487945.1 hypothetical protein HYH03_013524 [Edaphochlamys debaryana]